MRRREFIRWLGACCAGSCLSAPPLLATASTANDPTLSLGKIAFQLGWIKNFEFIGEYFADYRKYYQKFGLEVDLLPGGPSVTTIGVVISGVALIGQSSPEIMASSINRGAQLKCIGAHYQRSVSCIASRADSPILSPHNVVGKKIGITMPNLVIWHAFLKLNNIDPKGVNLVPVQADPTPLITREVDGFICDMNDDVVNLRARGYDIHALLFEDYGYKAIHSTYAVLADSLRDKTKRSQLVAFMKSEILGWQDAIKDPALGAKLTVDIYGKGNGLDPKTTEASARVANDFVVSKDTQEHGLFWMTPATIQGTITTLSAGGVKATPDMFTNEILEEAHQK